MGISFFRLSINNFIACVTMQIFECVDFSLWTLDSNKKYANVSNLMIIIHCHLCSHKWIYCTISKGLTRDSLHHDVVPVDIADGDDQLGVGGDVGLPHEWRLHPHHRVGEVVQHHLPRPAPRHRLAAVNHHQTICNQTNFGVNSNIRVKQSNFPLLA